MSNGSNRAVRKEYAELASQYDQRWSHYVEATVRKTVALLTPQAGDRLLDVGCGTGVLLRLVQERHPDVRLFGVDASPEMIAEARWKLGQRAQLLVAAAESLPIDDACMNVVVSSSVLHFVRRPERALAEWRRVLKSGGLLVVTDWCTDYLPTRLMDRYLSLISPAHVRALGARELRRLLLTTGFTSIRTERFRIGWIWGMMTVLTVGAPCAISPHRRE